MKRLFDKFSDEIESFYFIIRVSNGDDGMCKRRFPSRAIQKKSMSIASDTTYLREKEREKKNQHQFYRMLFSWCRKFRNYTHQNSATVTNDLKFETNKNDNK